MRTINWKEPVETIDGLRVTVVKPRFVKGLPVNLDVGRKAGPEMEWKYNNYGQAGVGFLPKIRNVGDC